MDLSATKLQKIFPSLPSDINIEELDVNKVPKSVAIIMDGNGRWAQARGMSRGQGHKAGIGAVREAIRTCNDIGVKFLTIYSFSSENWKRPKEEVNGLMDLFAKTMDAEIAGLMNENVRIRLLGRIEDLPLVTRTVFSQAQKRSANNNGMTLAIAVNYGSRQELCDATRSIFKDIQSGSLNIDDINEETIAANLYAPDVLDPDLIIRTSGEMRLSNFLLWQSAYSEFYISDILWPDFDRYELLRAILSYQKRIRRFGSV